MRGRTLRLAPFLAMLSLASCNSTDVLDPGASTNPSGSAGAATAIAPEASASTPAGGLAVQPIAGGQPSAPSAALTASARVQLAPIVGSTVEAITPLSRRLSARAAQRGISFAASGDGATTHIMKGYFSTITDEGETTVIYVWDVLDPSGNRLHRIQGQEKVVGATAEGWPGVPTATMEAVADRTIDQFVQWLASRQS